MGSMTAGKINSFLRAVRALVDPGEQVDTQYLIVISTLVRQVGFSGGLLVPYGLGLKMNYTQGLERWLRGYEHWLLF